MKKKMKKRREYPRLQSFEPSRHSGIIPLVPGDIETELAKILPLLLSGLKDVRGRRRVKMQAEEKEGHRWKDDV